jgi:hypothetical protein
MNKCIFINYLHRNNDLILVLLFRNNFLILLFIQKYIFKEEIQYFKNT